MAVSASPSRPRLRLPLIIPPDDREVLLSCVGDRNRYVQRLRIRAAIVLHAGRCDTVTGVANRVGGTSRQRVARWCRRYAEEGLAGLSDRPRPGRGQPITVEQERIIVEQCQRYRYFDDRRIARGLDVTVSTVARIRRRHGQFRRKRTGWKRFLRPRAALTSLVA